MPLTLYCLLPTAYNLSVILFVDSSNLLLELLSAIKLAFIYLFSQISQLFLFGENYTRRNTVGLINPPCSIGKLPDIKVIIREIIENPQHFMKADS